MKIVQIIRVIKKEQKRDVCYRLAHANNIMILPRCIDVLSNGRVAYFSKK